MNWRNWDVKFITGTSKNNPLSQFCPRTAAGAVTWPCLQRRGSPCEGPAPGNRTAGAGGRASCSLLVTTPALQTEGYEKQVTGWGNSTSLQYPLRNILVWMNFLCQSYHVSWVFISFTSHAVFSCCKESFWNSCLLLCINTDSFTVN